MTIHLRTWGDLACFTRPEMKVERVSYPVITPSATRGLLEAILYKPQFRWYVRRIAVKKPVRFLAFRRNEVKSRLSPRKPEPLLADQDRTQRNTLALRDVEYIIEASMHLTPLAGLPRRKPANDEDNGEDSPVKYLAMFQRRAEKGQCFAQPCFGCREFPAHFELADAAAMQVNAGVNPDTDLGLMLYDVFSLDVPKDQPPGKIEKPQPRITFFPARLKDGVMNVPDWSEMKNQLGGAP
ncbi:MAG: type I-C CRISPR-associated protein Cas5c [Verrucomicrobia bacterium]|jgi:CRISPR-associated protein Cas5d|nr:type I-C CRISPR-associated protein Cas5c [Verrucomicrobiota bacterium]